MTVGNNEHRLAKVGDLTRAFFEKGFTSFSPAGRGKSVAAVLLSSLMLSGGHAASSQKFSGSVLGGQEGLSLAAPVSLANTATTAHVFSVKQFPAYQSSAIPETLPTPAHAEVVQPVVDPLEDEDLGDLSPAVLHAARHAGKATGLDPAIILTVAWFESRFQVHAKNKGSTARGVMQFTDVSWLAAVRDFGDKHGMANLSKAIDQLPDGRLAVKGGLRSHILQLRDNPVFEMVLGAEDVLKSRQMIEGLVRRDATPTELYLSHVMGRGRVSEFLIALHSRPRTPITTIMKASTAKKNAGLFEKDGKPMTVANVYNRVEKTIHDRMLHYRAILDRPAVVDVSFRTNVENTPTSNHSFRG